MAAETLKYMRINVIFIPCVALSIGGLLMFQATNQMAMANFIAVLQALIVFPIASTTMYPIAINFKDPLMFVVTNPLNTGTAGLVITFISIVYLYKYLGRTRFDMRVNTGTRIEKIKISVPSNVKKMSYAERELQKSLIQSSK